MCIETWKRWKCGHEARQTIQTCPDCHQASDKICKKCKKAHRFIEVESECSLCNSSPALTKQRVGKRPLNKKLGYTSDGVQKNSTKRRKVNRGFTEVPKNVLASWEALGIECLIVAQHRKAAAAIMTSNGFFDILKIPKLEFKQLHVLNLEL
ncbi:hypothetical protein DL98DRAFT_538053 [Cadophora sp. DSE1049]|nr:hypothetical protein DL98DRAFT_538053 [Cadophora sp. DSE1049]